MAGGRAVVGKSPNSDTEHEGEGDVSGPTLVALQLDSPLVAMSSNEAILESYHRRRETVAFR